MWIGGGSFLGDGQGDFGALQVDLVASRREIALSIESDERKLFLSKLERTYYQ